MHKVREDKKKLDDRNGSIETITEVAEGDTAKANSEDGNGVKLFFKQSLKFKTEFQKHLIAEDQVQSQSPR